MGGFCYSRRTRFDLNGGVLSEAVGGWFATHFEPWDSHVIAAPARGFGSRHEA